MCPQLNWTCVTVFHVLTADELVLDTRISLVSAAFLMLSALPCALRVGVVWPSPPSHGCYGQCFLRPVRRGVVAGHRCPVSGLADSPGCGHFASYPASFLLVVSRIQGFPAGLLFYSAPVLHGCKGVSNHCQAYSNLIWIGKNILTKCLMKTSNLSWKTRVSFLQVEP